MATKTFKLLTSSFIFFSSAVRGETGYIKKTDFETQFYQELAQETNKGLDIKTGPPFFFETPNGLSTKDISPQCDPRRLEDSVIGKNYSNSQYYKELKKYFKKCSAELTQNSTLGVLGLLKFAWYNYSFLSHPQIKEFSINLSEGTIVPGILALKQDPRPRPLVIVKCGVFCAAEETASLKNYLMHLFDQSPFNVLLLANQTGMDYISQNKKISLGGWSEGYEAIEVAKWMLEQWENKDRISSIHFIGISLGGNAAVMGAAYNDKYLLGNGKKIFNSVTAVCPVVSLKPTLNHLYQSPIVGRIFTKMTKDYFKEARQYVVDIPDMLADDKIPGRLEMADFVGNVASTSLRKRGTNVTMQQFFKNNNFWNLKFEIKTPLMVWASKDDMVVNNKLNADVVEHDDFYEKSPYVGVVNLDYGNHCGFSSAYGSQASATVLRTFILNNSPEFLDDYKTKNKMQWSFEFAKMEPQYVHVNQEWRFYNQSDKVKVSFKIFDRDGADTCSTSDPWFSDSSCTRFLDYWISISSLKELGARVPRNEIEAQALTREFNTKVEFRTSDRPLNGTNSNQFFMAWRKNFE
ncbi:MAG: hypothetical protein ACXVCY_18440 [Pseudobdellovibrionaceae bacterium]